MTTARKPPQVIHEAIVTGNTQLCCEHRRMTMRLANFGEAYAGQFVHLSPAHRPTHGYREFEWRLAPGHEEWAAACASPMLRRAFSIAGLVRQADRVELSVIYRVVGRTTRWMDSLQVGQTISVLGPLGNRFPIRPDKRRAWLVAGGVGLPPMLWLAEALRAVGREAVAFCGSRSRELLPLALDERVPLAGDAGAATMSAVEFRRSGVPVVISTDDGSAGYPGHVGSALAAFHDAHPPDPDDLLVYTCGPEIMMRFVAEFCVSRGIECHACMERAMACGTGICQSCVVPIRNQDDDEGWCYRLCCTEGPVFSANEILWDPPGSK